MIKESQIIQLTKEHLETTNFFLVELSISSGNIIEVYIDGKTKPTISDCVDLSRHIESSLDREVEDFELRVFTAGHDRAFVLKEQYYNNINEEIKILDSENFNIKGTLISVNDDFIEIERIIPSNKKKKEKEIIKIEFDKIQKATKVFNFKKK